MPGEPHLAFFDTNILIHAACEVSDKTSAAGTLILKGGVISAQVLNEFTSASRRKYKMSWADIRKAVTSFQKLLSIVPVTADTHATAMDFSERYNLAFYDAVIAAAAHLAGCTILYSEDMHDRLQITTKLRLQNPFT